MFSLIGAACVGLSTLSRDELVVLERAALSLDVLLALPADLPLGVVCAAVLPSFPCRGVWLFGAADLLRSDFCWVCGSPWIHDQFGSHGCNFFIIAASLSSSSSELSDDDCPDVSGAAGAAGAAVRGPVPPHTVRVARPTGAARAAGVARLCLGALVLPSSAVSGASDAMDSFIICVLLDSLFAAAISITER